jgi:hypothetical protein
MAQVVDSCAKQSHTCDSEKCFDISKLCYREKEQAGVGNLMKSIFGIIYYCISKTFLLEFFES